MTQTVKLIEATSEQDLHDQCKAALEKIAELDPNTVHCMISFVVLRADRLDKNAENISVCAVGSDQDMVKMVSELAILIDEQVDNIHEHRARGHQPPDKRALN